MRANLKNGRPQLLAVLDSPALLKPRWTEGLDHEEVLNSTVVVDLATNEQVAPYYRHAPPKQKSYAAMVFVTIFAAVSSQFSLGCDP